MKLRKIPNGETLRPAATLPLELQELLSARGETDRTLKHPIAKVLSPILMITLSIVAIIIKSTFMILIALGLALIFGLFDIVFIKTVFKDMWKSFKEIRVRQFKWYEDTIVNKRVDRRTGGDDTLDTSAYVLEFYAHTLEVLPAVYNSLNKGDRAIVVLDMNNKICTALAAEIKT